MKKYLCLFTLLVVLLSLSACGGDVLSIEDYVWKAQTVMKITNNPDEIVVAVGEEDDIHPDAKIVNLILAAKDGVITLTDKTNGKIYSGSYTVQQKTPEGTDYEIIIDEIKGYATVADTTYYDGSEVPTLPINLGEYSFYFIPV